MLVRVREKIQECAEFRRDMETKYASASALAIDYIMMMKGEHGLLEWRRRLKLDVNFSTYRNETTELVTCTLWRPDNPHDTKPLLHVKMEVGAQLDEVPITFLSITEDHESDARATWSCLPKWSFLRRGAIVLSVVSEFLIDEADLILEKKRRRTGKTLAQ